MTDFPPGAIFHNRGQLWRVDGVQGEVLTTTFLDYARADRGRFYIPFQRVQSGRITADAIERQRQALQAEYQQFARHYAGEGGATPALRLETRSSDLLTVTMLYPQVRAI